MSRRRHVRPSSSAVPRHRRSFDPMRFIKPGTIGAVVIAFAALLGLGGTAALWQDSATIAPQTVTAGSIGVTQTGISNAAFTYEAGKLVTTTLVEIGNPKASDAQLTASAAAVKDPNGLYAKVKVAAWPNALANCDAASAPAGAWTGRWSELDGLSVPLPAGQTMKLCLRTSLDSVGSIAGHGYEASVTLIAQLGSWRSSTSATVAQSVAAAAPNAVPALTCKNSDAYNVEFLWSLPKNRKVSEFEYLVNGKTPNYSSHNNDRQLRYTSDGSNAKALVGSGTNHVVEVREKSTKSVQARSWMYVSFNPEQPYAQCAPDPATVVPVVPAVQWFSCTTKPSVPAAVIEWASPSGSHEQWKYQMRSGSKVIPVEFNQWHRSYELQSWIVSGWARDTVHRVEIVRTATNEVYYAGDIRIDGNGAPSCATTPTPERMSCDGGGSWTEEFDLAWTPPAMTDRTWTYDVYAGSRKINKSVITARGSDARGWSYTVEVDEDDFDDLGFAHGQVVTVNAVSRGLVLATASVQIFVEEKDRNHKDEWDDVEDIRCA